MKTSNSAIQTFKQCRRMYQLKYVYGFEPVKTAAALQRGISYHEGVERILKAQNSVDYRSVAEQIVEPKIRAMVLAFLTYILPELSQRGVKINEVEKWFEYPVCAGKHYIVGRADGLTTGHCVIEHKTTSGTIDGAYFQRLDFDEQIPTYMTAFGANKIYYTVCAVPSIRQKKDEADDEFCQRCFDWYETNTEQKIAILEYYKSDEDLREFAAEQDAIVEEIATTGLFYRNPSNCSKWGRMCEYASICKNCDPNGDYIEFKRMDGYDKVGKTENRGGKG